MIYRLVAYSFILFGITGTIYMGFEGIYGDQYKTPSLSLSALNRQLEDSLDIVLIDVRTPGEIVSQPAPWLGMLNIPLLDLETRAPELASFGERSIIVLCPTGRRSQEGARILRAAGYNAAFIREGMFEKSEKRAS